MKITQFKPLSVPQKVKFIDHLFLVGDWERDSQDFVDASYTIPMDKPEVPFEGEQLALDPDFAQQIQKLHRLTVYGRWLFAGFLWLTIAPFCLWDLRAEIYLLQQYFTWVGLRYALIFHPLSALGLSLCIAMTTSVLVWQSRNILWGLPLKEREHLQKQVYHIRQQGSTHPLWKWVCK